MIALWPLLPAGYFLLRRLMQQGFGNARATYPPNARKPEQTQRPAGARRRAPAGQAPSRTVQLKPGSRYRATLALGAVEALAPNEAVLARVQQLVGPWKGASASGDGATRVVVGTYAGKARTLQLPTQVVKFETLGASSSSSAPRSSSSKPPPASKPASKLPDPIRDMLDMGQPPVPSAPSSTVQAPADKDFPAGMKVVDVPAPERGAVKPAARKPAPRKPTPRRPASKPSSSTPAKRTAKEAAAALYAYVVPIAKAGRTSALGSKGKPNPVVQAAQRDMGLPADGIYGPATRTKGKQLLGKDFPPR